MTERHKLNDHLTAVAREFEAIIRDGIADYNDQAEQENKIGRLTKALQTLISGLPPAAKWASPDAGHHPNEDIYHSLVNVAMLMVENCQKMGSELTVPMLPGGEDAGEEDEDDAKDAGGSRDKQDKKKSKSKGKDKGNANATGNADTGEKIKREGRPKADIVAIGEEVGLVIEMKV